MEKATKTVLLQMLAEISDLRVGMSVLAGELHKLNPNVSAELAEALLKIEKKIVDPQYDPLRTQIEAL
jgi:hypothetical protein